MYSLTAQTLLVCLSIYLSGCIFETVCLTVFITRSAHLVRQPIYRRVESQWAGRSVGPAAISVSVCLSVRLPPLLIRYHLPLFLVVIHILSRLSTPVLGDVRVVGREEGHSNLNINLSLIRWTYTTSNAEENHALLIHEKSNFWTRILHVHE